jgi:hypothetical protein
LLLNQLSLVSRWHKKKRRAWVKVNKRKISYEKSCIITWLGKNGNSLVDVVFSCQLSICCTCLFSIEILLQWRTVDSSKIRRQKGNFAKKKILKNKKFNYYCNLQNNCGFNWDTS